MVHLDLQTSSLYAGTLQDNTNETESIDLQTGSGEDDDDDDNRYKAKVRTGVMDLKEAAVVNLGRIAAACAGYDTDGGNEENKDSVPETDPFAPFVERTLEVMRRLTVYFHAQIRVKSIGVLRNMILGVSVFKNNG